MKRLPPIFHNAPGSRTLLAGIVLCLAASSLVYGETGAPAQSGRTPLTITTPWKMQPAVAPDSAPDPARWTNAPRPVSDYGVLGPINTPAPDVQNAWWQNTFSLPADAAGRRVVIDFERVDGDGIVFLNGKRVAEMLQPGGRLDVTQAAQWGAENTLTIFLTRNYTGVSRSFEKDSFHRAIFEAGGAEAQQPSARALGVTAPVTILLLQPVSIDDVFCKPSFREKTLTLEVAIDATVPASGCVIEADIVDPSGKTVLTLKGQSFNAPTGQSVQSLSGKWENPTTWELDRPHLYEAKVRLSRDGKISDNFPAVTFGFREVWTEGRSIIMNGHPIHLRMTDLYAADASAIPFYQLMGYNSGQIQPHAKIWFYNRTPLFDRGILDTADRLGFGISMPAPSMTYLGDKLLKDPALLKAYEHEMEMHIKRFRNHPSILAWSVGMNSYCPRENIHPPTMGLREKSPPPLGRAVQKACDIAKEIDPTRMAYSHADAMGDLATSNLYMNFSPLQEREEWPMAWAGKGELPYGAAEFGQPETCSFWKGPQMLFTEYTAIYFGDKAYEKETEQNLKDTVKASINLVDGLWPKTIPVINGFESYWDFQKLFVPQTDRAWRTWGVSAGRVNWILDTEYGVPSNAQTGQSAINVAYKNLPPITEKPAWASRNFDIHSQANKPLLIYIGGAPVFTDKTHAYFQGEAVKKQAVIAWDGHEPRKIDLEWALEGNGATASGRATVEAKAGERVFVPIEFKAPEVTQRTPFTLRLTARDGSEIVQSDEFALQIFPRPGKISPAPRVVLHDPKGKTGPWLEKLGITPEAWKPGTSLKDASLFIIGREALSPGDRMPWTTEDLAQGLRVLVLEQTPVVWNQLGFQTSEAMPRYVFARDLNSPLMKGLEPEDLINWRGSPNLLPEYKQARRYQKLHTPKVTNRHAVASVVLEIPQLVGFTPVFQAEFDLAYSPLLEWRYGKGMVSFCTFDFTDRVGDDPAATILAANLLGQSRAPLPPLREVFYDGDAGGRAVLDQLQVAVSEGGLDAARQKPAESLLILSDAGKDVSDFVAKGGSVFVFPQGKDQLQAAGFPSEPAQILKVSSGNQENPLLRAIGPNLLRWRDTLDVQAFRPDGESPGSKVLLGGLLLEQKVGAGQRVFLQAGPAALADRYNDAKDKKTAVQLSVVRLWQLAAQILTNLNASPTPAVAERLRAVATSNVYETLGNWRIIGPFDAKGLSPEDALAKEFAAEKDSVAGAPNPNITYDGAGDHQLDWRKTADANPDGFVNLGVALNTGEGSVAYATRIVQSDSKRMVRLFVGVDYWAKVWLNGQVVMQTDPKGAPARDAFSTDVLLQKGENVFTFKVLAGGRGFGFWAGLQNPPEAAATANAQGMGTVPDVSFYVPLFTPFDPYEYTYW